MAERPIRTVDVNADLGEGTSLGRTDVELIETITSASIACGFHAGSPAVMRAASAACAERGVTVGAHVSFPDRSGFGRRRIERAPDRLVRDIVEQCECLIAEAAAVGATVRYVKPHGALYNLMGEEGAVAGAVVEAVLRAGLDVLVAQPRTIVTAPARTAGVRVVAEGFCDRAYRSDGLLLPRSAPGALIEDVAEAGLRARELVCDGGLRAVDGTWTEIHVETLCIHGDVPDAGRRARAVRSALVAAGIAIRPFATT
ncbi:MAG: 5-oxoprolinase subunit PxpA [Acidimicrobiales bacterium]